MQKGNVNSAPAWSHLTFESCQTCFPGSLTSGSQTVFAHGILVCLDYIFSLGLIT